MKEGLIIKGYGGFYYVRSAEETWRCRGRGRLRRKQSLLVICSVHTSRKWRGVIEIKGPKMFCIGYPMANVDQVIHVVSWPNRNLIQLVDRSLVICELERLSMIICFYRNRPA